MQFEDFDKKLKQAAEQHHPSYDEKAWSKMETLLDRHLPQKEDRRRRIIFFFLLLFLLLGGGTWLLIDKPWQKDQVAGSETKTSVTQKTSETAPVPGKTATDETLPDKAEGTAPPAGSVDKTSETSKGVLKDNNGPGQATITGSDSQKQKTGNVKMPASGDNMQVTNTPGKIGKRRQAPSDRHDPGKDKPRKEKVTTDPSDNTPVSPAPAAIADAKPHADKPGKNEDTVLAQPDPAATVRKVSTPAKDSSVDAPRKETEKSVTRKESRRKPGTFFLSISAGPDASSVGLRNPGKVRLLTGAGLGYTFWDRLTVRTGFYSASKIYEASPAEYKPTVPPQAINYLKNISADCKVYEIPLSLAYNFGKSEKHKTFASIGLSSFIMKKETYDYLYEYPGSPNPITFNYIHTVKNENKHYFSVLALSGGYQRRINRMLSVTAEPYFKLPLGGVGYGKVKLNSFGILFSLNISPFKPGVKK